MDKQPDFQTHWLIIIFGSLAYNHASAVNKTQKTIQTNVGGLIRLFLYLFHNGAPRSLCYQHYLSSHFLSIHGLLCPSFLRHCVHRNQISICLDSFKRPGISFTQIFFRFLGKPFVEASTFEKLEAWTKRRLKLSMSNYFYIGYKNNVSCPKFHTKPMPVTTTIV